MRGTHGKWQIVPEAWSNNVFLPVYVACIMEPPAGERPQSVAHSSAGNELIGRLSMLQLCREGFETSTLAVCTRSVVWSEVSEDRQELQ